MPQVMQVVEAFNNVKFTVAQPDKLDATSYLALQMVDRMEDPTSMVYANTRIQVGDLVLVTEVNQFLFGPSDGEKSGTEAISHIILGLIPPSQIHEIENYSDLVRPSS